MGKLLDILSKPYSGNRGYFVFLVLLFTLPSLYDKPYLLPLALGVLQSLTLAYVLCLVVTTVRDMRLRRALKIVLAALPFAWSLVDLGCIVATKTLLNENMIMLILETDAGEASGFFRQYFSWGKVLMIPLFYCLLTGLSLVLVRLWRVLSSRRIADIIINVMLLGGIVYGAVLDVQLYRFLRCKDYTSIMLWDGMDGSAPNLCRLVQVNYADPLIRGVHAYKSFLLLNKGTEKWKEAQRDFWHSTAEQHDERNDFNIVMIIGESYVREHTQIYGYCLPTTPYLQSEKDRGNLVTFGDVIVPANYTTISLRNVMNLNSLSEGEQWTESLYFPMLVKKAGWDVYHYDNQAPVGSDDVGLTQIFYNDINLCHVYSAVNDSIFDDDMDFVKYVDRVWAPKETDGRRMTIYHLKGQHFPYRDRYQGKGKFGVSDITADRPWLNDERRQLVADYDNATLHNDSVIARLMQRWRDKPTVMFYFGDHGEDVWDLGEAASRNKVIDGDLSRLDRQYHIPFMVWMSDSFMDSFQEKASAIRMAAHKKGGTTDLLGYMILGMTAPDSPHYRPERDLLSPSYVAPERVTAEGYEYDKLLRQQEKK